MNDHHLPLQVSPRPADGANAAERQWFVAYHEAGHAVVDYLFGHAVESVTIEPDGEVGGCVGVDLEGINEIANGVDEARKQFTFERLVMSALAGEIAQRKFAPESVDPDHAAGDRHQAMNYLEELDACTDEIREQYWRLLELKATAILERNWQGVVGVATELVRRRSLTWDELREAYQAAYATETRPALSVMP